jgi:penicillin-binding protein-related factor A (putative recombinase)
MIDMNSGKRFENALKESVPDYVLYHRLNDSTGTFSGGANLRFSSKQPCDVFLWNGRTKTFYAIEMKSSKSGSFSYEDIDCTDKQPSKMIHKHQILGLEKLSIYEGVVSGFIFNFRYEKENTERTYWQEIDDFLCMYRELNKKSFNEKDLLKYNPIEIEGTKKRTRWTWNMEQFLSNTRLY